MAMTRLCSYSAFAIFISDLSCDFNMHGTDRADPPPSGRLTTEHEGCMQQECDPFIRPLCPGLTFLDPRQAGEKKKGDATLQPPPNSHSCQIFDHVFYSKVQIVNLPFMFQHKRTVHSITHVLSPLPCFVCALVICRSQSPARSFSLPMICLFRSVSVMWGPSKTTVS